MTETIESVEIKTTPDYDTGLSFPNDPGREANYRLGFILEAHCVVKAVKLTDTLAKFKQTLEARERKAQEIRSRVSDQSHRAAFKRAGKKSHRPAYIESELCNSRFIRGQHQAAATTRYGVLFVLNKLPKFSLDETRDLLSRWSDLVIEWAMTADSNDSDATCPPFLHESLPALGLAVSE